MGVPSFFRCRSARTLLLALLAATAPVLSVGARAPRPLAESADGLSVEQFSRLVRESSEPDGFFRSDNFTSNETSYLHVIDRLKELHPTADAYVGVGPEQNFTYIAKLRPRIAFIVDIRRQAMLQHLLVKTHFHAAETRQQFLAALLGRPLAGAPGRAASTEAILDHFERAAPVSEEAHTAALARIVRTIEQDFRIPLSDKDRSGLAYVHSTFRSEGLGISTRAGRSGWGGRSPSLKELILQPDAKGRLGNFLATEEDYRFVRDLQRRNRIIPLVGDFGGPKAIRAVGDHLRRNGHKVSAFYTSNVEQYLFQNGVFGAFAENVRALPIDANSVFIRAVLRGSPSHPAYLAGHRSLTLLQKIGVFLRGFDDGRYPDYSALVTQDFIAGN